MKKSREAMIHRAEVWAVLSYTSFTPFQKTEEQQAPRILLNLVFEFSLLIRDKKLTNLADRSIMGLPVWASDINDIIEVKS